SKCQKRKPPKPATTDTGRGAHPVLSTPKRLKQRHGCAPPPYQEMKKEKEEKKEGLGVPPCL
ncbi:MAG: hypothetical protein LBI58_00200, partial [Tannerellaceae bacterium]|nr:hypothetical protein [Tannerellaceae bacterium]